MRLYLGLLIIAVVACKSTHQSTSDNQIETSKVLFTVNNDTVFTDEFIFVYQKNNSNNNSAFTTADIAEYLDLYEKFKLKIAEAKSRGIDTTEQFRNEFNTYIDQLKKPYLTDNKVTDSLVREAYERYKTEINASHILLRLSPDAFANDTLAAYNKILEIRKKAITGADFGALAQQYSEDPSAKVNKGNLGYFTSFQMVYPFENMAYNTPEGEVSKPVRSRFGYHIIKVNDKRKANGTVSVSHIMLRHKSSKEDSAKIKSTIYELYDYASGGVSWEDLVNQYSEDVNSKRLGGKLKPFGVGQMPMEFQEAAFSLLSPGDISNPVMTQFGWHIIRLEKKDPVDSFEAMEQSIRSRIKRDDRADAGKAAMIKRLKKENNFRINDAVLTEVLSAAVTIQDLEENSTLLKKNLLSINNVNYSVFEFVDYLNSQRHEEWSKEEIESEIKKYSENELMAYEEEHLADKYFDYKMLVKEYREGIMLFQLMEEVIWRKAAEDSVGLQKFFEANIDNYHWENRVRATIISASDSSILEEVKKHIDDADSLIKSKKELEAEFNKESSLTLQIREGLFEKGDDDIVDQIEWKPGRSELEKNGRFNLVIVHEVLGSRPKDINEIKGIVISDYQDHLDKQWIEQLRMKYDIDRSDSGLKYVYEVLEK